MATVKAPDELREMYIQHLTLLVYIYDALFVDYLCYHYSLIEKFSREVSDARNDTFKNFREWVTQIYPHTGCPSSEQWEQLKQDDRAHNYQGSIDDNMSLTMMVTNVDSLMMVPIAVVGSWTMLVTSLKCTRFEWNFQVYNFVHLNYKFTYYVT